MAIKSGIFNSVNNDRRYLASDFASYFSSFIANGVFPNPSDGFQVTANGDMTVTLKAGKAWIHGYYCFNDSDHIMNIEVADGVLKRIDRIVLRLDYLTREIVPVVKKGVFASSPVAPALQRDSDAYEIALADVLIGNGSLSITQANITDQRFNSALCGIVKGTVDQIDTTGLFSQYDDAFNYWFDYVKGHLNEDTAGNLQTQIGILSDLLSTEKGSLVGALNEHLTNQDPHNMYAKKQQEAWREAVLVGSYYNVNSDGLDYRAKYYKNSVGEVSLVGLISKTMPFTINDVIFTLPEGYRPASGFHILVPVTQNSAWNGGVANIVVKPTGSVVLEKFPSNTEIISLEGIQFRGER